MANKRIDEPTGTETVGHEWDGIEELDTPMPRWWLWTLYLTIIWGVVYVILYPAWPLVNKATEGVLGWSSRGELAEEMSVVDQERATVRVVHRVARNRAQLLERERMRRDFFLDFTSSRSMNSKTSYDNEKTNASSFLRR